MHSDNVIGVLRLHAVAQPVPMKTFLSFQGRLGGRPPSELEFVWPANAFLGVFPYGAPMQALSTAMNRILRFTTSPRMSLSLWT